MFCLVIVDKMLKTECLHAVKWARRHPNLKVWFVFASVIQSGSISFPSIVFSVSLLIKKYSELNENMGD